MTPEAIEVYVDAAAAALELPLAAAHRPGVLRYFALAASMAELVNAQTTVSNATSLNTQTQTTLTGMMQSIDGVDQNQIGEQILTLQNSLSASLSVTARLAQLSLVNYLSPSTG